MFRKASRGLRSGPPVARLGAESAPIWSPVRGSPEIPPLASLQYGKECGLDPFLTELRGGGIGSARGWGWKQNTQLKAEALLHLASSEHTCLSSQIEESMLITGVIDNLSGKLKLKVYLNAL